MQHTVLLKFSAGAVGTIVDARYIVLYVRWRVDQELRPSVLTEDVVEMRIVPLYLDNDHIARLMTSVGD